MPRDKNFRYLGEVRCSFSDFVVAWLMAHDGSGTMAKNFRRLVISNFGTPVEVVVDGGPEKKNTQSEKFWLRMLLYTMLNA